MPTGTSTPVHSVLADLQSDLRGAARRVRRLLPRRNTPTTERGDRPVARPGRPDRLRRALRPAGSGPAPPRRWCSPAREFARSLDAFPVEFGEIIDTHETLFGDDPFAGLSVAPADLRRACEGQTRSLLLHLREDYMEAAGDGRAIDAAGGRLGAGVPRARRPAGPPRRAPPHRPRPGGVGRRAAGARRRARCPTCCTWPTPPTAAASMRCASSRPISPRSSSSPGAWTSGDRER